MIIFNALQTSLSGGIGRYSYELSKAVYLLNQLPVKIVIREEDRSLFSFAKTEDLIVINGISNSKQRNYYEQFVLPREIHKKYPDAILHYPDSMAPLLSKNRVIITVHDLAFLSRKQDLKLKSRLWKNLITYFSVKKVKKIVCDTNFTKSELHKYYELSNDKAETVYIGFNDFSLEDIKLDDISKSVSEICKTNYILSVSTISPRKNMNGIIRAFNEIKDKTNCNLVICGKNGWFYENVFQLVDELKLQDRVIFTGNVNDNELKYLYRNSTILVYASFYEGFGLPPLEAMSYGIPCVVSNVTSIPEVVGNAALHVDPYSEKDIAENMLKLLGDEKLKESLASSGFERIKFFSWEKCAKEMISIYRKMLNS